jgi:uncharacterized protein (DUF58 family)
MKPALGALNPAIGWALAVAAVAVGYMSYGWPGVVLAISVVVFWLLLQFSRALRVMREAGGRPVGRVANAVMLHARLRTGLRLMDVLKLTRSLGTVVTQDPEVFRWEDDAGDRVEITLQAGLVTGWTLQRAEPAGGSGTGEPGA